MREYFEPKNRKSYIANTVFTILLTVVIITLFVNKEMFRYHVSNGTGIVVDQEYRFTPKLEQQENVIQQTFSPVINGLESIDIRLANEHTDDVDCVLLFAIYEIGQDEPIWQENVLSDAIVNWRYYSLKFPMFLDMGREYILKIQCPENRAGIPFKIFICNADLEENKDLFFDETLLDGGLDLIYNYNNFPVVHFTFLIILCLAGIVISWLKRACFKKKPWGCFVLIFSIVMCFLSIEYLSGNNVSVRMGTTAILMNLCILSGILFLFLAAFGSSMLAGALVSTISLVFALINHYTLKFRGTVLLPSDIYSVSTAYHVAHNYNITLDREILNVTVLFLLLILMLYKTNFKQGKKSRLASGGLALAAISWMVFISVNEQEEYKLGVDVYQDSQTDRSQELGFLLNFSENIKYLYLQRPEGYSLTEVQNVYDRYAGGETEDADSLPNIIVIMNESFADLRYVGDFDSNFEYMENFYRIAEEENAKAGKCVVSVYGGGTSCSEFEFLTGCSMLFLASGNAPYQQYVHKEMDALPAYLRQKEYSTYAVHAANPQSWNRDTAYPRLGFDSFISIEDDIFDNATYCRYWVDDKSMMDMVASLQEETEGHLFEFGITIQCHGGYAYENYESTVQVENMESEYPEVNQYLSLISEVDRAFGEFIETLKDSGEPVIVLMFGDHLPQLDNRFYNELKQGRSSITEAQLQLEMHETPYLFWANYDVDFSEVPDVISANFLSAYLLKAGGIELDPYSNYLYELSKKYPVVSRTGIMNYEGKLCEYSIGNNCYGDIHEYEMLQYSRLKN